MSRQRPDVRRAVEVDRVHKSVYTDPAIFDLEMERIFERVWIYCGHESQVRKPGDYYTMQIGRQPMVMVRGADGKVNVLYNRCPHRGTMLVGGRHGHQFHQAIRRHRCEQIGGAPAAGLFRGRGHHKAGRRRPAGRAQLLALGA